VGSTASLVKDRAAAGFRPAGRPAWLRKTARLLFGLAVTALIWESAVLLFAIRPAYLPRLSTILMAIAATMSMASCGRLPKR
jgi:NitT/TauT family transport system permease protein